MNVNTDRRGKRGPARKAVKDVQDPQSADTLSALTSAADTLSPENELEMLRAKNAEQARQLRALESENLQQDSTIREQKATISKLVSEKRDLESKYRGWVNPDDYPTRLPGSCERWDNEFELYREIGYLERDKAAAESLIYNLRTENYDLESELNEAKRVIRAWNMTCLASARRFADELERYEAKLKVVTSQTKFAMENKTT